MDFEEFAARLQPLNPRLYRTARMYLGDESSALEAVDEAVYKGLKALPKLREEAYFETWMTRILMNECKRELRRRKREVIMETLPEMAAQAYDALPLNDAVLRLPEELKAVISLRYFGGFTLAETAQSLQIPQGTVVTRQRRALALLKLELSEEDAE